MDERGGLGVDVQLLVDAMKAALLEAVDEVAKKLVSIFLSSLMEVTCDGAEVFHDGNRLDKSVGRVEDSSAMAMEFTHRTECLCVTCIVLHHHYIIIITESPPITLKAHTQFSIDIRNVDAIY